MKLLRELLTEDETVPMGDRGAVKSAVETLVSAFTGVPVASSKWHSGYYESEKRIFLTMKKAVDISEKAQISKLERKFKSKKMTNLLKDNGFDFAWVTRPNGKTKRLTVGINRLWKKDLKK